jgi:hypothetical protein
MNICVHKWLNACTALMTMLMLCVQTRGINK